MMSGLGGHYLQPLVVVPLSGEEREFFIKLKEALKQILRGNGRVVKWGCKIKERTMVNWVECVKKMFAAPKIAKTTNILIWTFC